MKVITFLHNASLIATALLTLALPGCHKEDTTTPAPSDATNAAQPASEQIPAAQDAQNDAPLPEEPKDQQANAAQDLQMLQDAAGDHQPQENVVVMYGPLAGETLPGTEPQHADAGDTQQDKKRDQANKAPMPNLGKSDDSDWHFPRAVAVYGPPAANAPMPSEIAGSKSVIPPKIKLHTPEVTGTMDKRTVQKFVAAHKSELRACYETELAKTKDLLGKVTLMWIINKDGVVSTAVIKESTLNNKRMEDCLINMVKLWHFPRLENGGLTRVEYPMSFTSESAEFLRAHPNAKPTRDLDLGYK